jgi:hypothetical protein
MDNIPDIAEIDPAIEPVVVLQNTIANTIADAHEAEAAAVIAVAAAEQAQAIANEAAETQVAEIAIEAAAVVETVVETTRTNEERITWLSQQLAEIQTVQALLLSQQEAILTGLTSSIRPGSAEPAPPPEPSLENPPIPEAAPEPEGQEEGQEKTEATPEAQAREAKRGRHRPRL